MNQIKEVITPREASQILGRATRTIEHGLRTGELPFGIAYRQKSGRYVYIIPKEAFKEFLSGRLTSEKNPAHGERGREREAY